MQVLHRPVEVVEREPEDSPPIASIEADADGEPRVNIYHDGTRLYAIMPDGLRENIFEGECSREEAPDVIAAKYGGCGGWNLLWAE